MNTDLVERLETALKYSYASTPQENDELLREAITALRALRDAPVVTVWRSDVRNVGWQIESADELPLDPDGQRVRLVADGDTTAGVGK